MWKRKKKPSKLSFFTDDMIVPIEYFIYNLKSLYIHNRGFFFFGGGGW